MDVRINPDFMRPFEATDIASQKWACVEGLFWPYKCTFCTELVACQKFSNQSFLSKKTPRFLSEVLQFALTERTTDTPFFPWAGNRSLWQTSMNRFLGRKTEVFGTMKQRLEFALLWQLRSEQELCLICDLSNELNTNDDKFPHKMIPFCTVFYLIVKNRDILRL